MKKLSLFVFKKSVILALISLVFNKAAYLQACKLHFLEMPEYTCKSTRLVPAGNSENNQETLRFDFFVIKLFEFILRKKLGFPGAALVCKVNPAFAELANV